MESEEDDWESDDEGNKDINDDLEDIDCEEDFIEVFTLENSKEDKNGKYSCNLCEKAKILNYNKIKQHFIEYHEDEFNEIYGEESNS